MLRIIFMGTPSFGVPILEALTKEYEVIAVVTQPDKEVGRHHEIAFSPVKQFAVEHHIPVFQPEKIKLAHEDLIALHADLIVTAAYGQFVGMKLLNSPKYRSINVHGSLLPKYRGGSPIQTAIYDGNKVTGITIIYMEKQMDAGDILAQRECSIQPEDTSGTLFDKLSLVGRDLLMETIPKVVSGEIKPMKQEESLATFAYNITKEQEEIDFTRTAFEIHNQIRAYNPSPIAHMVISGESVKVYESEETSKKTNLVPGKLFKEMGHLYVSCGQNSVLELKTVQPAGKKPMSARDAMNGALRKYLEE
jgi:methionyl-tRNA formyltransferase